mgnify:CR=1 FL=1
MSPRDEVIWVGPSRCDEARAFREEQLKNIWQILVSSEEIVNMHLVVGVGLDLFREALSCYQNGAFMASILMCGVALETLLYDLVSAVKGRAVCDRGFIQSIEPDYNIYEKDFSLIISEAKGKRLLDNKLENKVNKLRNLRNIVAHYAQRRWKQMLNQLRPDVELITSISGGGWASEKDAYEVLKDAANIIRDLIKRAYMILCR